MTLLRKGLRETNTSVGWSARLITDMGHNLDKVHLRFGGPYLTFSRDGAVSSYLDVAELLVNYVSGPGRFDCA